MVEPPVVFQPVAFLDVPGWTSDDCLAPLLALRATPGAVRDKLNRQFGLTGAFWSSVDSCEFDQAGARAFWIEHFEPHCVRHPGPPGLVTGYFDPVYRGSRRPSPDCQVPVYRRPPDLENVVAEADRASAGNAFSHLRRTAVGLIPFPTRRAIEEGALAGQGLELLWLADPVDAFILHVQGSGTIVTDSGEAIRLAYDGKNGHPYTSIGRVLIDRGELPAEGLTLDRLTDWLRADPGRAREVMWQNASFIFFRELHENEPGPLGAEQIPLTAGRSLAVDASIHALGLPIYVDAPTLMMEGRPFRRLMIAQDVGSAIRGPERGDIYVGSGAEAGHIAGDIKHPARFFVLRPRSRS